MHDSRPIKQRKDSNKPQFRKSKGWIFISDRVAKYSKFHWHAKLDPFFTFSEGKFAIYLIT